MLFKDWVCFTMKSIISKVFDTKLLQNKLIRYQKLQNINVIMQSQFYHNYDPNKMLMQTFGRGQMHKFVEPKLSERNAFEQEKFLRQKYARCRENQSKNKQSLVNKQKPSIYDEQRNQQNQQKDFGQFRAKGQFDDIDSINDKINGLIRSISTSCHKKNVLALKDNKVQKCQTNQKLSKKDIDVKRDELLESAIARKTFISGFDSFGIKEEPIWFKQQKRGIKTRAQEIKSKENTFQSSGQIFRKDEKKVVGRDEQHQIQQRIKKIQDKISVYQQKMGSLNPSNRKEDLIEKTVQKQTLKQIKDYPNNYSNSKNKMGSKILQKEKENFKKDEKTAKKEAFISFQKQSSKKYNKDNNFIANKYHQKQIRKQDKLFEALQIKTKNIQTNKTKQLLVYKKDNEEKQLPNKLKGQKKQNIRQTHQKIEKGQSTQLQSYKALKMHQKLTFIKALLKQIQYDQDFRHAKHMFGGIQGLYDENYQTDKEKWIKLKDELRKQGFSFNINEVKQIFMPRDDQIDPFMSVSHSHDQLIHGVIFAYQTAQKHWNDHIYRSWTLWQLKQSNFTSESLDRGRKGYISLQDLTFYINSEMDGNYRNRDLLLIYNRLGQNWMKKLEHGLSFKVIIDGLLSL